MSKDRYGQFFRFDAPLEFAVRDDDGDSLVREHAVLVAGFLVGCSFFTSLKILEPIF